MLQQTVRRIPLKGFIFRRPPDVGGPVCYSRAFKLSGSPCERRDDTSSRLFLLIHALQLTLSMDVTFWARIALKALRGVGVTKWDGVGR